MTTIDVRRANERFHTEIDWLDSWHSFSFSEHYDPKNTHLRSAARVLNDDVIAAGGGFGTHPHRDMEIVTWVLDGALEHRDSEGNVGVITRDVAQRMSAGTGIRHSEVNASQYRARPPPADVGPARRIRRPARLRAARHQQRHQSPTRSSRSRPAREHSTPRSHQPGRRHALDRPPHRRRARSRFPAHRSCTCSCPRGTRNPREQRASSRRATRYGSPTPAPCDLVGDADGTEIIIWAMESELATSVGVG